MNRQIRYFLAGVMAAFLFATSAVAQNAAPGAGKGAADQAAKGEAAAAPVASTKPDPAVDTIVDSNPQTPGALLQAASILADLDRVDLAKKYLQQLAAAKPSEEALAEAAAQVEPGVLLRLADNADLQPEGRQLSSAVLAAAAHLARDPARLAAEIERLGDPSRSVRLAALKRILAAHEDAVPALVAALGDASKVAARPLVREALVQIGPQGVPALAAALQSDSNAVKVPILEVLEQIGSRDAVVYLAAPATAEGVSADVREAARAALRELTGAENPTPEDAAKLLAAEIELDLKHDRLLKFDAEGNTAVWHWDAGSGKVVRENLPPDLAYAALAAQLAGDLIQLQPHDALAQRLFLVSSLEAAARRAGLDSNFVEETSSGAAGTLTSPRRVAFGDPALSQREREQISQLGPAAVEDALVSAMANKNYPAATSAARILGTIGDRSLLEARDGAFSPLVFAVGQGDRRTRFAAAEAIVKLKPTAAFAGSSDLMSALAFFADSPGERRALVAFPNAAVAGQLAAMLTEMGYEVDIATNSRQAFLEGISSGDYEIILLSSRLDHPPVWVILPELRHNPNTAHVPVALMAEDSEDDLERMQALAMDNGLAAAVTRPITPDGMKFLVERTIDLAGAAVVPAGVRERQALAATKWLKELNAASPNDFSLFPYEAQLKRMEFRPVTSAAAAEMLADLGKQTAQESLVDLANTASQPLGMRQAAAAAFSEAVRKHGILLTTVEIKHQYDRYNQSVAEDEPTQKLLGMILDAIELPTGRK